MSRIILTFVFLLVGPAFGEGNYFEDTKETSSQLLSNKIGKELVSELIPVSVESRQFLVSSGKVVAINKVIFVEPRTESQRKPNENSPNNIESRMAELKARASMGSAPIIFQYKAYVVTSGDQTKISEEVYESFFQIKKQL